MRPPETRFAKSGDAHIAYQVVGTGPPDLVYVPGWVSNVELNWGEPSYSRFLTRLSTFARLILFDKRGTGLSDRVPDERLPTLEQRMDDVRAVLDAVGSERSALLGVSEGGSMAALFAATYPSRTVTLIMYGSYARRQRTHDYPWGQSEQDIAASLQEIEEGWGGPVGRAARAPSAAHDEAFMRFWSSYLVQSASPHAAMALTRMNAEIDVRPVLPAIRVPTLILHRQGDHVVRTEEATYLAEHIPGAKLVLLTGEDHLPWVGDQDAVLDEIEEGITGVKRGPTPNRVLATVLFTDIVDSTKKAAALGDTGWKELLRSHDDRVRAELARFRGVEVKRTGDGFLATFDGPARAVMCARAISEAVQSLGIEVRAGCHTGEVEQLDDDLAGLAVHIGARVASLANGGEVLVSSTVKDLVVGSGLSFEDRGVHTLKGVPDQWHLYAVTSAASSDAAP